MILKYHTIIQGFSHFTTLLIILVNLYHGLLTGYTLKCRTSMKQYHYWLVFGRCQSQISFAAPTVLIETSLFPSFPLYKCHDIMMKQTMTTSFFIPIIYYPTIQHKLCINEVLLCPIEDSTGLQQYELNLHSESMWYGTQLKSNYPG